MKPFNHSAGVSSEKWNSFTTHLSESKNPTNHCEHNLNSPTMQLKPRNEDYIFIFSPLGISQESLQYWQEDIWIWMKPAPSPECFIKDWERRLCAGGMTKSFSNVMSTIVLISMTHIQTLDVIHVNIYQVISLNLREIFWLNALQIKCRSTTGYIKCPPLNTNHLKIFQTNICF